MFSKLIHLSLREAYNFSFAVSKDCENIVTRYALCSHNPEFRDVTDLFFLVFFCRRSAIILLRSQLNSLIKNARSQRKWIETFKVDSRSEKKKTHKSTSSKQKAEKIWVGSVCIVSQIKAACMHGPLESREYSALECAEPRSVLLSYLALLLIKTSISTGFFFLERTGLKQMFCVI